MRETRRSWRTAVVALGITLALGALGARAQEAPRSAVGVSVGSAGVEWLPQAARYDRLVLTVSGPGGFSLRQEFVAGKTAALSLFDERGERLADGAYTWQLEVVPHVDRSTQKALAAAREAGDEAASKAVAELQKAGRLPASVIESGSLRIEGGAFVTPGLTEPRQPVAHKPKASSSMTNLTAKDVVTADDAIIQGSLCVGLDCVNNESFGFDTIRLKENNTRIKFDDTSTGTGFPNHDWQLTANDSASGGANKFSIEDITAATVPVTVTGSAPTNSIFIDSSGRVGFRTSTPVLDLHVATSNTPALRLEQNNSGGFTAQTWDIAGNEANFFVRDVTGGSRLPFRIRPGAPTSSIDINASGNVGVGTASASSRLTLKNGTANADAFILQRSQADSQTIFRIFETTAGAGLFSVFDDTGLEATRFTSVSGGKLAIGCNAPDHRLDLGNGTGVACSSSATRSFIDAGSTTFTASSSRSLKENLEPVQVPNILDKIAHVAVYNYDFINGPKDKIGLMAEDFHTVLGHGSDKLINGQEVEMTLWLAVQELTTRNKELAAENGDLAKRLARLEALVAGSAARQ
ncbi:MAG TPA: tail fiber domain-containing protein [Thermoanaerobaculia bacterium]|nr:tail fiber domain-containing protein [Thermoanaerobaculia bacterium]